MARLAGKVAIVTGSAQGLGRATAELFAAEGAAVVIADKDGKAAGTVARSIRAAGGDALALEFDVASSDSVEAMVETAVSRYDRIDILVNNAAIVGPAATVEHVSLADWQFVMSVNLTGPFLCTKFVLPIMSRRHSGSIVNISSASGVLANSEKAPYNVSKHGLIGLTRCTAQDYGHLGIRANAVCPTGMNTPMTFQQDEARMRDSLVGAAQTALGRLAEPDEVARAVRFLASDEASYITGAVVMVDGGLTAIQPSYSQLAPVVLSLGQPSLDR